MVEPIDMLERDERAAEAKELLDNALLQEVFKRLEDEATERWKSGLPADLSLLELCRVQALRAVYNDLIRLVEDPKMLRAAAERRRRRSQ